MGDANSLENSVYSQLAAVDANWLKEAAISLRLRLRRTVSTMLEAGDVLIKARRRLGLQYNAWLAAEAQIAPRSASRLCAVSRVFSGVPGNILEYCTPTALYALAEPGVPQSMREYAVEYATDGKPITMGVVEEWLKVYRENPSDVSLKLATKDPKLNILPEEVNAAENWLLLLRLIGRDGSVHLSASTDTDPQINDLWVHGTYMSGDGKVRRTATQKNLESVVLCLTGNNREKVCPKCPIGTGPKPLDMFSRRRDQPDGRNRYCLECEKIRVREYERKRRMAKRA